MKIEQSNTAIHAYHNKVPSIRQNLYRAILEVVNDHVDMTIGEIAHETGIEKSTVSARRNEMLESGMLIKGRLRKCSISGIMCETVEAKNDQ